MATVREQGKALDGAQRSWLKSMGDALGVPLQQGNGDDIPLTGVPPGDVLWAETLPEFRDADAMVEEMEQAEFASASRLRQQIDTIKRLVDQQQHKEAIRQYNQVRPEVDAQWERFVALRGSGVQDLPEGGGALYGSGGVSGPPGTPPTSPAPVPPSGGAAAGPPQVPFTPQPSAGDPNAAQYQTQVLKMGAQGPAVAHLQNLLNAAGVAVKADSSFGPATQQAVKQIQTSKGLPADGVVGPKTWAALTGGGASGPGAAGAAPSGGTATGAPAGAAPATTATQAGGRPGFIGASVGKGGKNNPEDVKAVQDALNKRDGARLTVDGQFNAQTLKAIEQFQKKLGKFKPDGLIEPGRGTARALSGAAQIPPTPPEPKPIAPPVLGKATLDKGAMVWHSTRNILATNIEELKKGVRAAYGTEHSDLLKAIDQGMVKLGSVLDKLDTRLADALDGANKASSDQARSAHLQTAKSIMVEYIHYLNSEPLVGHMDKNPFGVQTSLKRIIGDALKHLSQLIPPPPAATR